jgi:hypothetical protein
MCTVSIVASPSWIRQGYRSVVLLLWCFASHAAQTESFRDADAVLQVADCAAAQRWAAQVSAGAETGNRAEFLRAAQLCADSDAAAVRLLLAQSRTAAANATAQMPYTDVQEARLLLQLGEHGLASDLLQALTARIQAAPPATADQALNYSLSSQQHMHVKLAQHFRASEPGRAIAHQFAAAAVYRMERGATTDSMANVACMVALDIAMESKQRALQVDTGQRLFAMYPSGSQAPGRLAYAVAKLVLALDEQGHGDAALALAMRLQDSGWPDAASVIAPYIEHRSRQ